MGSEAPLLIGEAPGTFVEGGDPLTGAVGHRIASLLGITEDVYMASFRRANLFDYEIVGKWPWADARHSAADIRDGLKPGERVVLLGVRVADAFEMLDVPLYVWQTLAGTERTYAIRVPHPSGRNRLLNDQEHRARFATALLSAVDLS
jgi:uracil-DNA glycosylase